MSPPNGVPPRALLLFSRTSYRARAFLEAATRLGVEAVVGSDHGQALADASPAAGLELDFGRPREALRRIRELAVRAPLAAVVGADDAAAVLAARAARALGLRGSPPEAVRAARLKHEMRRLTSAAGVPGPAFRLLEAREDPRPAAEAVGYPCVLKPVHLSASRGVIRADDPAELLAASRRIAALLEHEPPPPEDPSARRLLLVEEYLPGAEVAVEGLVVDGRLRLLALLDKPDPMEGPFFEETILVTPSRLPPAARRAALGCVADAARALGLRHGPVHGEVRVEGDAARLLEVAPRSIGGLCSRVLRFNDGATLEEVILRHAADLPGVLPELEAGAAGVMMVPIPRGGRLRRVGGVERARLMPGIEDAVITIPVGERVVPLPEGHRYLGFLFARAQTPLEAEAALRRAHAWLELEIG